MANLIKVAPWLACFLLLSMIILFCVGQLSLKTFKIDNIPNASQTGNFTLNITIPKNGGSYTGNEKNHFQFSFSSEDSTKFNMTASLKTPDGEVNNIDSGDPLPVRPGEYNFTVTIENAAGKLYSTSLKFNIRGYTISIVDSFYVIKNIQGSEINRSKDLGALFAVANHYLVSGDTVFFENGVYDVFTPIIISENQIILRGDKKAVIRAVSTLHSSILELNDTRDCLIEKLAFDSNFNTYISPSVLVSGYNNIVSSCNFTNAIQYCLQAWKADHFEFINNTLNKSQYALCTGGDKNKLSTNGVIANNFVIDAQDCGVKLKWAKNCQITNNTIDVGYITWTKNSSDSTTEGGRAIDFYTDDGPDYNCTASGNHITDSKQNRITEGIVVDTDRRLGDPSQPASYGLQINNNDISGTYYGLLIKKAGEVTYSGNTFSGIRYKNIYVTG